MSRSEELFKEAAMEDNDLKFMGKHKKAVREKRIEDFQRYLPKLEELYTVIYEEHSHKYTIDTSTVKNKYGIIDFFPKGNKVLIRAKNKWKSPGLAWILKKLLND